MTTGGMAADINSVGIPSKIRSVFIDPYDAPLNLIGHRHEVAVGFDNAIEVEHDEMCAGVDEHFGLRRIACGDFGAPSAAMDEDIDWRVRTPGQIDIKRLYCCRSVG